MNLPPVTKKVLFFTLFISVIAIIIQLTLTVFDNRTKIVFCDVGQGDAAYIRVKNKIDILIDAGPNRKILDCLGKHMPFYDRTIEYAFLSHPQSDHGAGYIPILERYRILKFLRPPVNSEAQFMKKIERLITEKRVKTVQVTAPRSIHMLDDVINLYWPQEDHYCTDDVNCFSLVFEFKENTFRALFTGDAPPKVLNRLLNQPISKVSILKVPHHGSKNGLTREFLKLADPVVSVISVGKNNSYGHPSKEILEMLKATKTKIRRTDIEGDIIFKMRNYK